MTLALLGLLDFSNDVLDLFINRPIAIDIDVDAGYTLPSMDGDDLVGVDPNRDAVGQGELDHWHWHWLLGFHWLADNGSSILPVLPAVPASPRTISKWALLT